MIGKALTNGIDSSDVQTLMVWQTFFGSTWLTINEIITDS